MTTTTPQAALLSDDEIEQHFENNKSAPGRELRRLIGRSIEAAILAKLQSTQEPVQAGELPDERAAFEQWASDNGEFPRAVARSGDVYHLMATQTYWLAWQARAALSARKPLTKPQIRGLAQEEELLLICDGLDSLEDLVSVIERAHGIGLEVKP